MLDVKFYYEIHVCGKQGFSTAIVSDVELDHFERINKAFAMRKVNSDDLYYIDYTDELTFEEWDTHFNFKKD